MFCTQCGARADEGERFCTECGCRLPEAGAQAAGAQAIGSAQGADTTPTSAQAAGAGVMGATAPQAGYAPAVSAPYAAGSAYPSSALSAARSEKSRRVAAIVVCASAAVVALVVVAVLLVPRLFVGQTNVELPTTSSQNAAPSNAKDTADASDTTANTGARYTDEDGGWIEDESAIEAALSAFAAQTGVEPYVYVLKNGSETSPTALEEKANELYGELFSDEDHFLLVFCDDGEGSYNCGYCAGASAGAIMDDEACVVLEKQLNIAYNDMDLTEEEIFARAFEETAEWLAEDSSEASGASESAVAGSYTNARYGYSVEIPDGFVWGDLSPNQSGRTFTNAETGMTIAVSGSNNPLGYTLADCYDRLREAHDVSYEAAGENWCVVSYVENETVYYLKEYVGEGSMNTISFSYPESAKGTCDKVLEQVVVTFSPGDLGSAH